MQEQCRDLPTEYTLSRDIRQVHTIGEGPICPLRAKVIDDILNQLEKEDPLYARVVGPSKEVR